MSRTNSVILALGFLMVACGGNGNGNGNGPSGPTEQAGNAAIVVEVDGSQFELSVRSDIPMSAGSALMWPTLCAPNYLNSGQFAVMAIEVDADGNWVNEGRSLTVQLSATGVFDYGVAIEDGDGRSYVLDLEDPGTWTISGNRLQGAFNVLQRDQKTTATLDVTCP